MTMTKNDKMNALTDKLFVGAQAAVANVQAGGTFADRLASIDQVRAPAAAAVASELPSVAIRRMPLDEIQDREADIRPINAQHMLDLAESIAAVGLLQFPVVDESGRLLAGGHRREAVRLLREVAKMTDEEVHKLFERGEDPDPLSDADVARLKSAYSREFNDGIVVRVFDSTGFDDRDIRVKVEAIENEKRLDFTKGELAHIVERLKAAGYRDVGGRPKDGQRVLSQELERIMGKSRRTVFRLLDELRNPKSVEEKTGLSDAVKALAEEFSEKLGTKVSFRQGDGQTGSLVINYSSFKQRAELLRELGLKK